MKKRIIACFFLVILCLTQGVYAQIWDGKTDSEWYWDNQQKTEFTIATAAQLAGLAQLVNGGNDFSGKTIKLTANIMLNDTADWQKWNETKTNPKNAWTPIGSYTDEKNSRPFSGTFDGGGKTISGVYINSSDDYKGLFGYVTSEATIKNLGISASFVRGGSNVGGLVGWSGGTITDCYVAGSVTGYSSGFSNYAVVGGLVGSNEGGTITNSYATGNVDGGTTGGLVGSNEGGTITNSYATGNVKGNSSTGGLVGENSGSITDCYATGNMRGQNTGGLVGINNGGTITDCYATGNVKGNSSTGGLVGSNGGTITNSYATGNVDGGTTGGLVGENSGSITDCYATGNVKGNSSTGGLVGRNRGSITNCYAMGNVKGNSSTGGLVGENSGTITDCYATGNVISSENSGGLVGNNNNKIAKCYAMGNVNGSDNAGGLVGNNASGSITNCYAMGNVEGKINGGLVGINQYYDSKGKIENSYATGKVSGTSNTNGGLVGTNGSGTITKSYYDRQTSGQSDIVKGEPKSTTQMKQQAIFEDWDFDESWKMDEKNNGYPYLQSSEKSLSVKYKYTNKVQQGNVLTDKRDGKKYKTVAINTKTWMAENLNYNASGSKCYESTVFINNKMKTEIQANCVKYGRLYDWKTAMKACPSGWHLPTHKEWDELDSYADMYVNGAGTYLNATSGWGNKNGTDDFGFMALPGGYGTSGGSFVGQIGLISNYGGYWWSSFSESSTNAYHWSIYFSYNNNIGTAIGFYERTGFSSNNKSDFLSIRCVQDPAKNDLASQQTAEITDKDELGSRRGSATDGFNFLPTGTFTQSFSDYATGGFNAGYAEGCSGGIGDMLGSLMGGSAGCIGTKAKGSLKAPSARDIDMGSGDGSRSKQEIMQVVNARMPGLRNIYNKYLKLKPDFSGKVVLKFTIAPGGDIISIAIVSSTTDYSDFDNAVKSMVATWKWKVIKSGNTTPTIPFNFTE
jgi:TonB family protein